MTRVFRNPDHQALFDAAGFVVTGSISPESVDDLRRSFESVARNDTDQMYSNTHGSPPALNRRIARAIVQAVTPVVDRHVDGYTPRGATFLTKGCGPGSVCKVHQDWNSVDESKHTALVCWVPLIDVGHDNGCLVVLPGSHRTDLPPTIRSAAVPSPHLDINGPIRDLLVEVPMRAGEVCFFSQDLFHGSLPNLTDVQRPALYVGLLPDDVQMVLYHPEADALVGYAIDEEFYYSGQVAALAAGGRVPTLAVVDRRPFATGDPLTAETLVAAMQRLAWT